MTTPPTHPDPPLNTDLTGMRRYLRTQHRHRD